MKIVNISQLKINNYLSSSKRNAFTLIELLVVIAIIGILSTIITYSVLKARVKAQDTKAVSEISNANKAAGMCLASDNKVIDYSSVSPAGKDICDNTKVVDTKWPDISSTGWSYLGNAITVTVGPTSGTTWTGTIVSKDAHKKVTIDQGGVSAVIIPPAVVPLLTIDNLADLTTSGFPINSTGMVDAVVSSSVDLASVKIVSTSGVENATCEVQADKTYLCSLTVKKLQHQSYNFTVTATATPAAGGAFLTTNGTLTFN